MGKLADLARERAHTRTIEMSTFAADDTHILCTGRLKDVRFLPSFTTLGEERAPGTLHDFSVHLLIRTSGLVIEEVEVSIDSVPRRDCLGLEHTLDGLKGLAVKGGFGVAARQAAGGRKGCTHLVHLVTTMASAILQGHWALLDRRVTVPDEETRKQAAESAKFLKDSCYAWREEGDAYRALVSRAEAR